MKKIVITFPVNQGLRHFGSMEYYEMYGKLPGKHFLRNINPLVKMYVILYSTIR